MQKGLHPSETRSVSARNWFRHSEAGMIVVVSVVATFVVSLGLCTVLVFK